MKTDSSIMAACKFFHVALHNLILHAELLAFELKKDVFTMMTSALKLSPLAISYFSPNAKQISLYLIS